MLGMKRAPCYKTIQNTMKYLSEDILSRINLNLIPDRVKLAGVDSTGLKTHQKGAWVVVRFGKEQKKRDFKKVHILVDLLSKKIIYCLLTKGTSSDSKQLKKMLRGAKDGSRCGTRHLQMILKYKCINDRTKYSHFSASSTVVAR